MPTSEAGSLALSHPFLLTSCLLLDEAAVFCRPAGTTLHFLERFPPVGASVPSCLLFAGEDWCTWLLTCC